MAAVLNHWTFRDFFIYLYFLYLNLSPTRYYLYFQRNAPSTTLSSYEFSKYSRICYPQYVVGKFMKVNSHIFPKSCITKSINCTTVRINNITTNHEHVDSIMRVIFKKLYHWSDLEWRSIINMLVNPTWTISFGNHNNHNPTIMHFPCIRDGKLKYG